MGGINYYKPGDWLVTCDSCGKKMKASHARHRWDGFIVCDSCWEPRHSHDFIKVRYDKQEVPFSRRPQETFIDVPYTEQACTPLTRTASADFGTADCAIVGNNLGNMNIPIIKPTYHDPYWDNVVLAMHMDGADGSTTFIDEKGHTITPTSGAEITTTYSKFGGSSYDGTTAKLTVVSLEELNTPNWTIEYFAYYPSHSSPIILEQYSGVITLVHCSKYLLAKTSRNHLDSEFLTTSSVNFDTYPHIAIVKEGSDITVYANGTEVGTASSADYDFTVGEICGNGGTGFGVTGMYIDDLRITKGIARYTADFTPPTLPFTNY